MDIIHNFRVPDSPNPLALIISCGCPVVKFPPLTQRETFFLSAGTYPKLHNSSPTAKAPWRVSIPLRAKWRNLKRNMETIEQEMNDLGGERQREMVEVVVSKDGNLGGSEEKAL